MGLKRTLGMSLFIWFFSITSTNGQISSCFSLQSDILGKTCVDLVEFSATGVRSKVECVNLCRGMCAGVFYSGSSGQCVGCRALYDGGGGFGTMEGSVYYTRKWRSEYIGCFMDCQNTHPCPRRVMQHRISTTTMTLEMCADHCKQYGLQYYGTQNKYGCFCDDETYDEDGPATNCVDPCAGNNSQICGGYSANSVYKFISDCKDM